MPVARRIRTLRESRGLSLRGLADSCNVSPATLSQIEQGQTSPSVATLEKPCASPSQHCSPTPRRSAR